MREIKFIEHLYQKDCIFRIKTSENLGLPSDLIDTSLEGVIDQYKFYQLSPEKFLGRVGNYILIEIFNPSKYKTIIPITWKLTIQDFKYVIERNSYRREIMLSPDGSEIYREQYFDFDYDDSLKRFRNSINCIIDYSLLYENEKYYSNITSLFRSDFVNGIPIFDEFGNVVDFLTDKLLKVTHVPSKNELIDFDNDLSYTVWSSYYKNEKSELNDIPSNLYEDIGVTIPVSTMKFV